MFGTTMFGLPGRWRSRWRAIVRAYWSYPSPAAWRDHEVERLALVDCLDVDGAILLGQCVPRKGEERRAGKRDATDASIIYRFFLYIFFIATLSYEILAT